MNVNVNRQSQQHQVRRRSTEMKKNNVLTMKQKEAIHQQQLAERIPNINFSKYQWGLAKRMAKGMITDEEALFLHQGTFNSFCRGNRDYVLRVRGGYTLSEMGHAALDLFSKAEVVKDHPSANLGKWVSLLNTVKVQRTSA